MKELSLPELKEIEFEILKSFHVFCVEHHLRYYLAYGTLLGAVRYKGFIPWDDDVDVMMPREDYNRFLELYEDSARYHMFAFERDPAALFPFAKICDMTTRKEEPGYRSKVSLGVDIDIFPLDNWADNLENARREAKRIGGYMFRLGLSNLRKPDSLNLVKRFAKGLLMQWCRLRGGEYYVRRILQEAVKEEQRGSCFMGTKTWCVYGERNIVPSEAFSSGIEIEFEGEKFFAPVGYDTYLTCLYGDYLPEPPKEKQKTHHSFRAYKQ